MPRSSLQCKSPSPVCRRIVGEKTERTGFEPVDQLLTGHVFSKDAHSTTLPPLPAGDGSLHRPYCNLQEWPQRLAALEFLWTREFLNGILSDVGITCKEPPESPRGNA